MRASTRHGILTAAAVAAMTTGIVVGSTAAQAPTTGEPIVVAEHIVPPEESPAQPEPTDPPAEPVEAGSGAPADYTDPLTGDEWDWDDLDNSGDEKDAEPIDWPEVIGKEPASDTGCADPALDAPDGSGCIPTPIYEDDPAWDCVTMGNFECGAFTSPHVSGRTFIIEFNEAGEPVAVREG